MLTALAYCIRIIGLTIATLFFAAVAAVLWPIFDDYGLWGVLIGLCKAAFAFIGLMLCAGLLILPFAWADDHLRKRRSKIQ